MASTDVGGSASTETPEDEIRAVQLTPPRSGCSIAFGKGLTAADPGSAQRFELVVDDIEAAREDLISRGVEVSELFHRDGGNGWLLQEVNERPPSREWGD
jgi:hypothetical protein